jgi:threonine aldolase
MSKPLIDLRSDTVTKPTTQMREAMARAEVGDDVYGEDPTANALEQEVAAALGKEAGLFTPSGTMANQIALWLHARPSEEILVSEGAHLMLYESGAGPALSGVQLTVIGKGGVFAAADVEAAYKTDNGHYAPTRAVAFENTHNRGGGRVFPQAQLLEVVACARKLELSVHLDGARLWNAHVATGIPLSMLAAPFDTVSVCLSKGLGAPVGSVLTGGKQAIQRARRRRKMLGGGMRQAGVLAAAARYAFHHHIPRLAEDHLACRAFAEGIAAAPGVSLELGSVETNLCIFDLKPEVPFDAAGFVERARSRGLLLNSVGPRRLRVVTHLDVDRAACVEAARITSEILKSA